MPLHTVARTNTANKNRGYAKINFQKSIVVLHHTPVLVSVLVPRRTFPCSLHFAGVRGYMRCDDRGEIYVDGVKMGKTSSSSGIWTSVIPRTTRLIAIKAESTGSGNDSKEIIASFSNGFKTSTKWKCSTAFDPDWYTLDFDDSDWGHPKSFGAGQGRFEGATKIWRGSSHGSECCRGYMGEN